jgi:thiamine biosynthesis lipoprotein
MTRSAVYRTHPTCSARGVLALAAMAACQPKPSTVAWTLSGEIFGAPWRGVIVTPTDATDPSDAAAEAAASVFAAVDAGVSTWRPDSDVMRCREAEGPLPVSGETARMVVLAKQVASATGGAFEPTIAPLTRLWGVLGVERQDWPADAEVQAAKARVGHESVAVAWGDDGPTLDCAGRELDLSGIAPGYAADRVSEAWAALGLMSHLVDVGGEVRVRGPSPSGRRWRLGIETPASGHLPGEALSRVVALSNAAIATSGNYRHSYRVQGREVVHEIDPRTGQPAADAGVASASVIADTAAVADGWATALMVLGPQGLGRLVSQPGVEAMLLVADPAGGYQELTTPGWDRWRTDEEAR